MALVIFLIGTTPAFPPMEKTLDFWRLSYGIEMLFAPTIPRSPFIVLMTVTFLDGWKHKALYEENEHKRVSGSL